MHINPVSNSKIWKVPTTVFWIFCKLSEETIMRRAAPRVRFTTVIEWNRYYGAFRYSVRYVVISVDEQCIHQRACCMWFWRRLIFSRGMHSSVSLEFSQLVIFVLCKSLSRCKTLECMLWYWWRQSYFDESGTVCLLKDISERSCSRWVLVRDAISNYKLVTPPVWEKLNSIDRTWNARSQASYTRREMSIGPFVVVRNHSEPFAATHYIRIALHAHFSSPINVGHWMLAVVLKKLNMWRIEPTRSEWTTVCGVLKYRLRDKSDELCLNLLFLFKLTRRAILANM